MATRSISTILRGILFVLIVFSFFGLARLYNPYIIMSPVHIWPGLELWRLATYVFGSSFGGFLIGIIAFSQPGEEIESMLGRNRFVWLLLAVTLSIAFLYALIFFGKPYPILAGAQNLGLFVMVGYVYLYPHSSVRLFFFDIRSKILLLLMSLLALGLAAFGVSKGEHPFVLLGDGGWGLLAGAIWFHAVYQKYPVMLGPMRFILNMFRRKEERAGAKESPSPIRLRTERRRGTTDDSGRATMSDEDRLDAILEKIGSDGYESLSSDERRFLDEYSSRL